MSTKIPNIWWWKKLTIVSQKDPITLHVRIYAGCTSGTSGERK